MIHQLIFAHPKPGMSEQEFQDYWVDVHAVQYASKIPQIRKYLIDTRIPLRPTATYGRRHDRRPPEPHRITGAGRG